MSLPSLGWARIVALAVCIGIGMAFVVANVRSWELEDADAYWNAALRLRAGQDLYVAVPLNADEMLAYRYAPWLAWLWVPLTYLPKTLVQVGWSVVLLGSVAAALLPLVRIRTVAAVCLVFLMGGLLVRTASTGNVHALLIGMLVWGAPRRSGPLWIGLAASLKIVPIAYALIYVGRHQWAKAALSGAVTVALLAPTLLYDLSTFPYDVGDSLSLLSQFGPFVFVGVAALLMIGAVAMARTRHAWAAASLAAVSAVPRLALYDLTYFLVGADMRGAKR